MEKIIHTPRLTLYLLETSAEGSRDLKEMHIIRSSPGATIWSILGVSKSLQDTAKVIKGLLPSGGESDTTKYRATYIVHKRQEISTEIPTEGGKIHNEALHVRDVASVIGGVTLKECQVYGRPLSDHLTIPQDKVSRQKVLKLEAGYGFLPEYWGNGYAGEAMKALMDTYHKSKAYWNPPYERVYFEAIVGPANPRSMRVLEKVGFRKMGIHEWEGPDTFIGGAMQPPQVAIFAFDPTNGDGDGNHEENPQG